MARFSTREAAKRLGIDHSTLAKYIERGKVPMPETVQQGKRAAHSWTEEEIEQVRELLPKIANGRKTRYQKQSAKTKAQPRAAVPHKYRKPKKK
jgi:predicted site-specific integrase-resolvase